MFCVLFLVFEFVLNLFLAGVLVAPVFLVIRGLLPSPHLLFVAPLIVLVGGNFPFLLVFRLSAED